jgi:hypothetical protein
VLLAAGQCLRPVLRALRLATLEGDVAVSANAQLAARARELAARAPAGSLDRRACGCAAVALATTSTPGAARKVLTDDCPDVVKAAALAVLDQFAKE